VVAETTALDFRTPLPTSAITKRQTEVSYCAVLSTAAITSLSTGLFLKYNTTPRAVARHVLRRMKNRSGGIRIRTIEDGEHNGQKH
jgi:hypothetical protein